MKVKGYNRRERKLREASYDRKLCIINDTIGEFRIYQGTIILQDTIEAQTITDTDLLFDIKDQYGTGTAIALWADRSAPHSSTGDRHLGAGLAWQQVGPSEDWEWKEESIPLGVDTGESVDAELFAVAAALKIAEACRFRNEELEVVRIFSDCLYLLEDLEHGRIMDLGPAISPNWALQDFYDITDFLEGSGVSVQLMWQKGHAMSEGNQLADIAARNAAQSQMRLPTTGKSVWKKKQDCPQGLIGLGQNSVDEWYRRMNRVLMLQGLEESDQVDQAEYQEETESQGSADMDLSDSS
jgi:ribonuclease HI